MLIVDFDISMQDRVEKFFEEVYLETRHKPCNFQKNHIDMKDIYSNYIKKGGFWMLVGDDGNISGIVGLRIIDENGKTGEVKRLYVSLQKQGNGYGEALLVHLAKKAKEMDLSLLRLTTQYEFAKAINLYKKHGFYEIEKYCEYPVADLYMEKVL